MAGWCRTLPKADTSTSRRAMPTNNRSPARLINEYGRVGHRARRVGARTCEHPQDSASASMRGPHPDAFLGRPAGRDLAIGARDRVSAMHPHAGMFVSAYGAAAGNLALTVLSTGGLYLGGGIAPRILPALRWAPFMRSFLREASDGCAHFAHPRQGDSEPGRGAAGSGELCAFSR